MVVLSVVDSRPCCPMAIHNRGCKGIGVASVGLGGDYVPFCMLQNGLGGARELGK